MGEEDFYKEIQMGYGHRCGLQDLTPTRWQANLSTDEEQQPAGPTKLGLSDWVEVGCYWGKMVY